MSTLTELVEMGKDELRKWILDNPWDDLNDQIFEIADCLVPIYTSDLLQMANDNLWLATTQPEILAFDGTCTPVNTIAGNIYEHINMELWEYANTKEEILEDKRDDIRIWIDGIEDKEDFQENSEEYAKWASKDLSVSIELVEEVVEEYIE